MKSGQSAHTRRAVLRGIGLTSAAFAWPALSGCQADGRRKSKETARGPAAPEQGEAEIGPTEDLMREHGVLRRLLLVFDALAGRLAPDAAPANAAATLELIRQAATINQSFVENYHELMEEKILFPRFRSAGRLVELVEVLQAQHTAGRRLTDRVLAQARGPLDGAAARARLADALRSYARMYRPHAAREDTVLFPALHELLSAKEFEKLGDEFEDIEHEQFGANGFEDAVARVAQFERELGIYELAQFTPT